MFILLLPREPWGHGQVRAVHVVQVLEFPELPFRHQGFLTALEFVTQELHQPVQARFQVYRLMDGEGEASPVGLLEVTPSHWGWPCGSSDP